MNSKAWPLNMSKSKKMNTWADEIEIDTADLQFLMDEESNRPN